MKIALIALLLAALTERREHLTVSLGGTATLGVGNWGYGKVRVTGGGVPDAGYDKDQLADAVDDFLGRVGSSNG